MPEARAIRRDNAQTVANFLKEDVFARCKWGLRLLKSRVSFLTSEKHKQDYKQRGTTTCGEAQSQQLPV